MRIRMQSQMEMDESINAPNTLFCFFNRGGETRRVEEGGLTKPYEKPWDAFGPLSAQLIREIVARELRQELEEASASDLHFRLQSIFSPKANNASLQELDHGKRILFFILCTCI